MAQPIPPTSVDSQSVEPGTANGAQIPLEDFNIPQFPREAGGLMALTLTSAVKLDQYSEILKQPFSVSHLPPSIQSLTLELFALGYPAGFLKALVAELPELRSLVIYSQLFTGTSDEASKDAVAFFKGAKKLRALHLLDAFLAPAFVRDVAPVLKKLEKPLMFLEVNYTNRAEDEDFIRRIPAAELPLLIHPGLISCSFNIAAPDITDDQRQGDHVAQDGIQTLNGKHGEILVEALLDEETAPRVMKLLSIPLYLISTDQLRQLVAKHKGLMVLNVSINVGNDGKWKTDLFNALAAGKNLEQVEIVLCSAAGAGAPDMTIEEQRLVTLSRICKKLASFKVNQLRCTKSKTSVECSMNSGKWNISFNEAKGTEKSKDAKVAKPKAVGGNIFNHDIKLMMRRRRAGVHGLNLLRSRIPDANGYSP
jgi:hypothetical protein